MSGNEGVEIPKIDEEKPKQKSSFSGIRKVFNKIRPSKPKNIRELLDVSEEDFNRAIARIESDYALRAQGRLNDREITSESRYLMEDILDELNSIPQAKQSLDNPKVIDDETVEFSFSLGENHFLGTKKGDSELILSKSFPKDKLNIKDTLTLTPFTIRIERRRSSDDLDIAKSIKRQFSVENTQMALSLAGHFAYSLNEARFGNPHKVQHPLADRYSY